MRVGPYLLHSLHDSLCNGLLKTMESGIENHTKIWQDFSGMLTAFSRHLSRYSPLMDRPAVLRWLCADETCSAQCLRRRTLTAQLRILLSTLLAVHDA